MDNQKKHNTRFKNLSVRCCKRSRQSITFLLMIGLLVAACEEEQTSEKPNRIDTHISKTGVPQKVEEKKESVDQKESKRVKPEIAAVIPQPDPLPDPYPIYEPDPDPYPIYEPISVVEPMAKIEEQIDPVLDFAEKMPEFPGGQPELLKFINANLQYPQLEMENGIQGKVYVRFTITKEGLVKEPRIMRGVNGAPSFDREVIRIIKLMPNWIPGENAGKKVSVYYTMPIKFNLDQ